MSKGSRQRPHDVAKFAKNYEAIFKKTSLASDDFFKVGCRGMNLATESEYKPAPCEGCAHRRRCSSEHLACERYVAYSMNNAQGKPVSFYMDKPCVPNRADFNKVWGDR